MRNNKKGFTLIELLVVIVIIGLLATMALIALNSARAKGRDAKRVADVKQIQTALELYYNSQNGYPVAATGKILGEVNTAGTGDCTGGACLRLCDNSTGFQNVACSASESPYMALVPSDPDPGNGTLTGTTCSKAGETGDKTTVYLYTAADAGGGKATDYKLTFCLEGTVNDMLNKCTASPAGLTCGGTA